MNIILDGDGTPVLMKSLICCLDVQVSVLSHNFEIYNFIDWQIYCNSL